MGSHPQSELRFIYLSAFLCSSATVQRLTAGFNLHRFNGNYEVSFTFADGGEFRHVSCLFPLVRHSVPVHDDCSDSSSYSFRAELRCSGLDWYEFGDFCYKPFGDRKTWHDAQSACRGLGAELLSIASMAEQSWVESYLYMGMKSDT